MKKIKNAAVKGFTLIELIVVMAIFSVLLVAIMSFMNPVQNIMKNAAQSERTYSMTNNIEDYLKNRLEYAENVWVFTEDQIDGATFTSVRGRKDPTESAVTLKTGNGDGVFATADLDDLAQAFATYYFKNDVTTDDGSTTRQVSGQFYIMRLVNGNKANVDTATIGQITQDTYSFKSQDINGSGLVKVSKSASNVPQLNPSYFSASDAAYNIHYALGAHELMNVTNIAGRDDLRCLKADYYNTAIDPVTVNNLAVSIVLGKKDSTYDFELPVGDSGNNIRIFTNPVSISIANLPLMNISYNRNKTPGRFYYDDLNDPANPEIIKYGKDRDGVGRYNNTTAFYGNNVNTTEVNMANDIYIVYSYATDLK